MREASLMKDWMAAYAASKASFGEGMVNKGSKDVVSFRPHRHCAMVSAHDVNAGFRAQLAGAYTIQRMSRCDWTPLNTNHQPWKHLSLPSMQIYKYHAPVGTRE